MAEIDIKELEKDYLNGLKYVELIEKYKITHNELQNIIRRNKWKRTKSAAQKGNKNAKGNKGGTGAPIGSQNALKTGEYETIFEDVLTAEEQLIFSNETEDNQKQILIKEYNLLTIREKRMLSRIKNLQDTQKDLTIVAMRKANIQTTGKVRFKEDSTETTTEAIATLELIQKIEEGLTRVQEAKRKCLETVLKIDKDDNLNVNLNLNSNNSILESINKQLGGG